MNCIDCKNLIYWDKYGNYKQCEFANEEIQKCGNFINAKRRKSKLGELKNGIEKGMFSL